MAHTLSVPRRDFSRRLGQFGFAVAAQQRSAAQPPTSSASCKDNTAADGSPRSSSRMTSITNLRPKDTTCPVR